MTETGVVIDDNLDPIFWHLPPGRTAGSIPDTRVLWDVIWENREILKGIAHSHPGSGIPSPSHIDLTTFKAIEQALGRSLIWWITSADSMIVIASITPFDYRWVPVPKEEERPWAEDLRKISAAP